MCFDSDCKECLLHESSRDCLICLCKFFHCVIFKGAAFQNQQRLIVDFICLYRFFFGCQIFILSNPMIKYHKSKRRICFQTLDPFFSSIIDFMMVSFSSLSMIVNLAFFFIYIYIYIYIHIYCHPQTDLFRSIRTLQCG